MAFTNLSAGAGAGAAPPCCLQLQLHLVRRPALLSPPCLRHPLRVRVRVRAQPSPSPDSFAGWSGGDEDDGGAAAPATFGGLLGAGLAGAFFLAGLTFAAISMRTNTTTGTKAQMEALSAQSEATAYSTDNAIREDVPQVLLPSASEDGSTFNNEAGRNRHPVPLNTNEIPGGQAEQEQGMEHLSQSNELVPHDVYDATDCASKPEIPTPSDGSESLALDSPMSNSVESVAAAYGSSHKLSSASRSEETLYEEKTHSEVTENQQMDEISTSYVTVIDSRDVPAQEISDTAIEAVSHSKDKDTEQNPELYKKDDISPSGLPDYIEYGSADQILPFVSNDLPTEGGKLGKEEETLGSEQNGGEIEIEKQNDFLKSAAPDNFFSPAGIPAPSLLSAALQVPSGQIVVPAAVDPTQGNALAALQVLKVIEPGAQAGDLCTRREYARWLVVASNCLSRNTFSKVYPAMYIENVTELAFDDVTPEDPDFPFIQGLAEAGLISSKLSRSDMNNPRDVQNNDNLFSPESPLSRQDLVSWKMALDKGHLPEVNKNSLYKASGYIDIDKINAAAWPALAADLGAGDQSITALAFGFTRLFQPYKPVTKGQAALALSTGDSAEMVMEELARIEAEKIAEAAVNAHGALVAQVEKDLNASFERELTKEREKIETLEQLAEEARMELDKLRAERDEEKNSLIRGRAAVESEMEVLSKLRCEVEEQLQTVLSKKVEISFEKNRIDNIQKEIETENQAVLQLQYDLEVERKALSMARAWAEEEAKKAREHARALEEARNQWERQGIKVVVEGGLEDDAAAGMTWANTGKEHPVDEAINRAESMLEKLKSMSTEMKVRSCHALEKVMQHVRSFISSLKQQATEARQRCTDFGAAAASKAKKLSSEAQGNVYAFGSTVGDKSKRLAEDCKEGLEKFVHRFKTD